MIQRNQPPTNAIGAVGAIPAEDTKVIADGIDGAVQGAVSKAIENFRPTPDFDNALSHIKAAYTAITGLLSH